MSESVTPLECGHPARRDADGAPVCPEYRGGQDARSPRESWLFLVAAVVAALSRLLALARSPWDWDEILFMLALRDFDVTRHHPHPPGFPLFIAAGKLLRLVAPSDFRALQLVNLICGCALMPVAFFLARQLRMRFLTALSASLLLAFLPNIWFYGGTALSDVPSLTIVLLACALLLKGREDRTAYFAGALTLAVAAGIRPQNLLIGFLPALLATRAQWRRQKGPITAAAALSAVIVAVSYGAAIVASGGWSVYHAALRTHQHYIAATDSVFSPLHPPLWQTLDDFFFWPYRDPPLNVLLMVLIAASLVSLMAKPKRRLLILLGAFGPFALFALLFLDFNSASRFSIGYAPLFAFLAADGAETIGTWAARILRRGARAAAQVEACLLAVALLLAFLWTTPSLGVARSEVSPPVAAVEWLAVHARKGDTIYVQTRMEPFADLYLGDFLREPTGREGPPARWTRARAWFLSEVPVALPEAASFRREPGELWNLVRHRYFEAHVYQLPLTVGFGDGWYPEEQAGERFRWMTSRSVLVLPPAGGEVRLRITLGVPAAMFGAPVTVMLDGRVLDPFEARGEVVEREYSVVGTGRPAQLVITTDRTVRAPGDPRPLALRLHRLVWQEKRVLAR
jgi:4-amino-4-deoxy-L-arabinose transferase-like glycosyltransferase